jgi:hypothetical protein
MMDSEFVLACRKGREADLLLRDLMCHLAMGVVTPPTGQTV